MTAPPGRAPRLALESELHDAGYPMVAGVDEVGRGCLGGPVTAFDERNFANHGTWRECGYAAVHAIGVFNTNAHLPGIDDVQPVNRITLFKQAFTLQQTP